MPLQDFFEEQFDALEVFLLHPDAPVRVVRIDSELRPMLLKYLVCKDEEPEFPHLLIGYDAPFRDPVSWFAGLGTTLTGEIDQNRAALAAAGVADPFPSKPTARMKTPERFLIQAEHLAHQLPDSVGALTFVLEPEQIDDAEGFRRSLAFLADHVRSPWLKFLVLEERSRSVLDELVQNHPRVDAQVFWLSPEELGERAERALAASGGKPGPARQQAAGFAAAVAFARKDYTTAEALQRSIVHEAGSSGAPVDQAVALYNLGNTLLAQGDNTAAVEVFAEGAELCNAHQLDQLAPMLFTNLGVALHRIGEVDQAFASLKTARDHFRADGNRPGEAHVCDCLAALYQEVGRAAEAAQAWRFALQLYEGITNPALADVRSAGRADILAKLERLRDAEHGRLPSHLERRP